MGNQFELTWNDGLFYGVAAEHARVLSIKASKPLVYLGTVYYLATIRIALDNPGNQVGMLRLENTGLLQIFDNGSVKERRRILDEHKVPIVDPVPLLLNGRVKPAAVLPDIIPLQIPRAERLFATWNRNGLVNGRGDQHVHQ